MSELICLKCAEKDIDIANLRWAIAQNQKSNDCLLREIVRLKKALAEIGGDTEEAPVDPRKEETPERSDEVCDEKFDGK